MSCDPLSRRAMLFWIAGPSAVPPALCLSSTASGFSAQPYGLLRLAFQAAAANIPPAVTQNRRKLLTAAAALSLKSP